MDKWCVQNFGPMAYIDPFRGECFLENKQVTVTPTAEELQEIEEKKKRTEAVGKDSSLMIENIEKTIEQVLTLAKFGKTATDYI